VTSKTKVARNPFFLSCPRGARFAVATQGAAPPKGGMLFLHPFAEEMNKSRRMVTLAAEAFAARGWLVLQIDLAGCGDSAGDFGDVDWQWWIDDAALAWSWLRERCSTPLCIWSLRAGCLVVADWLARTEERPPLLLWQPVVNGQQHLTHFLRLKSASEMLTASGTKGALARVRADLDAGSAVEVAGYRLSPALAKGLGAATLRLPERFGAAVAVLEASSAEGAESSPAVASLAARWREEGIDVEAETVQGPAFWQTQEIETAPQLISASLQALDRFVR
jgi:exosortase A-associated hydrolase 2